MCRPDCTQSASGTLFNAHAFTVGYIPPSFSPFHGRRVSANLNSDWTPVMPAPEEATFYTLINALNETGDSLLGADRKIPFAYYNENGLLMFYVADQKIITWCRNKEGAEQWVVKAPPPPYPIMGLNEMALRPEAKVIIVADEKRKECLSPLLPEVVVITWFGGDKNIKNTDWRPLSDVSSVLGWPEASIPGDNAMNKISKVVNAIEKDGTG